MNHSLFLRRCFHVLFKLCSCNVAQEKNKLPKHLVYPRLQDFVFNVTWLKPGGPQQLGRPGKNAFETTSFPSGNPARKRDCVHTHDHACIQKAMHGQANLLLTTCEATVKGQGLHR